MSQPRRVARSMPQPPQVKPSPFRGPPGGNAGVVRMNISVPRDLKACMDEVDSVNWSAVASQAFRAKLRALESRRGVRSLDDVIARLRAAEEVDSDADFQL